MLFNMTNTCESNAFNTTFYNNSKLSNLNVSFFDKLSYRMAVFTYYKKMVHDF